MEVEAESALWLGGLVLVVIRLIFVPFYFAVVASKKSMSTKKGMSTRQAADYWREKFRDDMALREQQETLLRASQNAAGPDALLRAATQTQEQHKAQLLRVAGEQE